MKKDRPPYLIKRTSRHGKECWYVWRRPAPQIRLREPYGSKAFWAEYRAALYGEPLEKKAKIKPGSMSELIADYMVSSAWRNLSPATRKNREGVLKLVEKASGAFQASEVDRAMVVESRERTGSYASAKQLITTLRSLFSWGVDVKRLDSNPAENVAIPPPPKGSGWHTWTEEEIQQFEARWPIGTRQRLWMAVLLNTGLRRTDAVMLKLSDIREGEITVAATSKNGTPVVIPLEPELEDILKRSPIGEKYVFESLPGEPYTPGSFSVQFGKACKAAGIPGRAHGLRKTQTTRLAYASGTVSELNAAMGWTGSKMALKYTEKADRARLAKAVYERARKARRLLPPSESGNN